MLVSGRSLQSAMALLVYAWQRVWRENGVNLLFALQLFDFFGVGAKGGQGGACFGGTLPSATALLVCACQRVGRVRTRRSGFRWISTLGGGAFGICKPACREGEHTDHFVFACAFQFSLTGGRCFRGSLQSAAVLLVDSYH